MRIFVTGIAGFIGMHVADRLAAAGHTVTGVDNFNDYYDPGVKTARAQRLGRSVHVEHLDISDTDAISETIGAFKPDVVVHLAAQAGVRYSLENPMAYVQSNLVGHVAVLEACRALGDSLSHLVYASSSSVYGGNEKTPFSEEDPVVAPVSLYAATKRADELISHSYAHLYQMRQIGLRFFTVYGPWGRPDMAYWSFTDKIIKGEPIRLFNHGDMLRDFTWIDDIVAGVVATVTKSPSFDGAAPPSKLYNLGHNEPVALGDFVDILEDCIGTKAIREYAPMQPGDVPKTYADIVAIRSDYGFAPTTSLEEGLPEFVSWFRRYRG